MMSFFWAVPAGMSQVFDPLEGMEEGGEPGITQEMAVGSDRFDDHELSFSWEKSIQYKSGELAQYQNNIYQML